MSCPICCETFNKSTRKEVQCLKCNETFCSACVKKYIIEEACMCLSCKCEWDIEFLSSVLTKNFMTKEYRAMQRKKLFDKETALLPSAMYLAESTLKKENLQVQTAELDKKIKEMYCQRQVIYDEITYYHNILNSSDKIARYKPETVSGCPKEGCRGFISRKKWSCGICDTQVCKDCFEVLKEEGEASVHVCKQENIETANMIMKECKPCPK